MMTAPNFEVYGCVSSTMDVARDALVSGRVRLTSMSHLSRRGVVAFQQTGGRGQRGRSWHSPPGDSLYVTFFYRRGLIQPACAGQIALLAGAAAADALSLVGRLDADILPGAALPLLGLKWPNDLLLSDRKVGGILTELVRTPGVGWTALIGMGINLTQSEFPAEISSVATSLRMEGFPSRNPLSLAGMIADRIDLLADRQKRAGFDTVLRRWSYYDRTQGRRYVAETPTGPIFGKAVGIDATGALLLRQNDRRIVRVFSASSLKEEAGMP